MALAYLDPAAGVARGASSIRSDGLVAGSRAPLSGGTTPRRPVDLVAVARGFAASAAGIPELGDPEQRTWVLVAANDLFEAWAIGWPRGGRIELHDHGVSGGAVAVAAGALSETTVRATRPGVALISTHRIGVGEHRRFGPGYVHDLINDGDERAISVHVYGPRLTSMTYYRLDGQGRLGAVRTEQVPPVRPLDTTCGHDPS